MRSSITNLSNQIQTFPQSIIHKIMEGRNYGTLFVGDKKEEFFLIDYIEKLL